MKDDNAKSNMRLDGKMNTKDAGKAGIILAYGKSIALVMASATGAISATIVLLWQIKRLFF